MKYTDLSPAEQAFLRDCKLSVVFLEGEDVDVSLTTSHGVWIGVSVLEDTPREDGVDPIRAWSYQVVHRFLSKGEKTLGET